MNPLADIMSPRARKLLYAIGSLAALVFAAYEAAGHNWKTALVSLASTGFTALAHANTNPEPDAAPPAGQ